MTVTVYITVADYWKLRADELLKAYKAPDYHRRLVERFILPEIGAKKFTEVETGDLEAILRHARERGTVTDVCRQIKTMMKKIFTLAHQERLIPELITDQLKPIPHTTATVARLTTEQELALLDAFRYSSQPELYTLILITGLPYRELGACRISDFDEKQRRLWLRRKLERSSIREYDREQVRWIPLTEAALSVLQTAVDKAMRYDPKDGDAPLFQLKLTDVWSRVPPEDYAVIRARSGLEGICFKDIERSFGIRAIEMGVNPRTLNRYLGYKTPNAIMRYAAANRSYATEAESVEACFDAFTDGTAGEADDGED